MKITPASFTLNQLLGSANEKFVIPSYQRRYSWRAQQLFDLINDVDVLEGADSHLLGSIVCLTGDHVAGLNSLELVDGQQRLTTISIILECLRARFENENAQEHVQELDRLLNAKPYNGPSVRKIALDTMDSVEFQQHIKSATEEAEVHFLNPRLRDAFVNTREWVADEKLEDLLAFKYRLLNQAFVVRLDVSAAKDAFKLFETINNRGLRLSPTDLIKNFVLGNAARFGPESLNAAKASWSKLTEHLDRVDSDAFFRFFIIARLATRLTKSQVVSKFQNYFMNAVSEAEALPDRQWYGYEEEGDEEGDEEDEGEDTPDSETTTNLEDTASIKMTFEEFMTGLVKSAKVYGELINQHTGDPKIDRHLRNLGMIKATQSYGLLMHLRASGISKKTFIEVLKLTESFILRRHVCRERANDTEALFAKLCNADPKNPISDLLAAYREACPTDEKFAAEFANAAFTSNIIDRARYCLEQLELAKHGEHAELGVLGTDSVHVEHIIPKRISTKKSREEFGNWEEYLGNGAHAKHSKQVNRIGNLTLFSGTLNIVASNNPFRMKKQGYKASSILMTKELSQMTSFKFSQVDTRSKDLADKAVLRWAVP